MTFENISVVNAYYFNGTDRHLMGKLALDNRQIWFEYSPDFLATGLEVSPFKLPLRAGPVTCQEHCFEGLYGIFNDSLPDGWGRLLLERKLKLQAINPSLSALDRLCYVGNHGMGALTYEPEIKSDQQP